MFDPQYVPSDNIRVAVTAFLYTNTEPVACVTSAVDHGGRCIKVECCDCYAKCAGEEMMSVRPAVDQWLPNTSCKVEIAAACSPVCAASSALART